MGVRDESKGVCTLAEPYSVVSQCDTMVTWVFQINNYTTVLGQKISV
jgi:hypothetical protein